jgi:Type II CAAX prenyl endopeptidase Rce1-like
MQKVLDTKFNLPPFYIICSVVFVIVYFLGLYNQLGSLEGYGWSNSILLDRFTYFTSISVPKNLYPFYFGVFYFFISVPLQEYIFRVLPIRFLKNKWSYIFITTTIFTLCHVYYMGWFSLILTFGLGLLLSLEYWYNRNFWALFWFHLFCASLAFTLNLA